MARQMIYLASRSPRRRELLKQIGVTFEIALLREDQKRGADVDETPQAMEKPDVYCQRVARTKAELAAHYMARRAPAGLPRPVLAADTTVVCDNAIIGKPADRDDAAGMLRRLSGRQHEVITAVAVALFDRVEQAISISRVWFRPLAEDEIKRYVATGEPLDKAGAYAIQGRAAAFANRIEGSFSGIMGLPLAETAELLRRFGIEVV